MTLRTTSLRTRLLPALAVALVGLSGCASDADSAATPESAGSISLGAATSDPTTSGADSSGTAFSEVDSTGSDSPGSSAVSPDGQTTGALLPPAEGVTEYPLTVTTAVGEVTIHERPERVVMASSWDGDLFAELGVTPVGTDEQLSFYPWTEKLMPGIETIWPVGDDAYPAEKIASTSPDLIVDVLAVDPTAVEKIGAIAPVIGAPAENGEDSTWQERIRLLGEVFDLSSRAENAIEEYEASFEKIRSDHPEFAGTTVDYLVFWGGEYGIGYGNTVGSDSEALLTDLGFDPNPEAANAAFEQDFSEELVGTLKGDVLVISQQGDLDEFDEFYNDPLLQSLESVKSGRVIVLQVNDDFSVTHNDEPTNFRGHFGRAFSVGPLSKLEVADLMVPLFADVLK